MKLVTTVAGVIVNDNNQILCTLRDIGKYEYVSLKWEFPGGKIEEGETQKQTLARELMEELEMEVEIGDFFYQVEHDYPDFHLSMAVYLCKFHGKDFKLNVHRDYKWLNVEELSTLDWAEADIPVSNEIQKQFLNK